MWCIGSTLSGLFDNCPYKNSRADGSRLLRPTKPPKRKVRRTFLYRESERVEREVLVVTRRRKPEKEVRLLPNRHGLGRNCPQKYSGTDEATLLRLARPLRKECGRPDSTSGGPARAPMRTFEQGLSVPQGTALFHQ